jgi:hypothetical protein
VGIDYALDMSVGQVILFRKLIEGHAEHGFSKRFVLVWSGDFNPARGGNAGAREKAVVRVLRILSPVLGIGFLPSLCFRRFTLENLSVLSLSLCNMWK